MTHRWDALGPEITGLVRPVRRDPAGVSGPTRGQARGPGWRSSITGWHVPAGVRRSAEQRVLEQSVRAPRGAVTGWASLLLHRVQFCDGLAPDGVTELPVPLVEGEGRLRPHPAIAISRGRLDESEVVVIHEIRCTTVERALVDEMRRIGELREADVVADMVFAAQLTSISRMRRYATARPRSHGQPLVLASLDLASEDSRSPMETRLRLIWVLDAGWAMPLCNRLVLDAAGGRLGRPDLLDEGSGVAGEFDGADHREGERHRIDVRRQDLFGRAGLEPVAFVGADVRDTQLVVARLEAARDRARLRLRSWQLGPTPSSLDSFLDRRDALTALRTGQARST